MAAAKIKGIPPVTKYSLLISFANNVVTNMTLNIAFYAVPAPTLVSITAQATACATALALWGTPLARGSHADLMDLRAKCFALRALLIQEAGYVINTVVLAGGTEADQAANVVLSGYSVKNLPTPQGLLNQPENFHQWFLNRISIFHVGLKWKKPIGVVSPGNVKLYQVLRGTTNSLFAPTTVIISSSTKTSFIDATVAVGTSYFYWIVAINDLGGGAPTASLPVVVPM